MNENLERGFSVKTLLGKTVRVESFLAEGGQGAVYVAECDGEKKALKWYKKGSLGEAPRAFYENIRQNVLAGPPSDEFLWPLDITEWVDGTFGYIMDLRPEGYYEITEYMLCHVRFKSFKVIINAALKIVSAFRILHNKGYSYQDLNDGNFFINPEDGDVLICDNDNVAPDGTETGIVGKPRYMAPEIVLRKNKPDSLSDRFSMSVILYILFCLNHPLEGKKSIVPGFTAALQEKLYGREPLFMMDPEDKSNGPHPIIHKNSILVWSCLPKHIQDIFIAAFSKRSFEKPHLRPKEIDWLKALTRFRSEIVNCQCGNEIFTQQGEICECENCGRLAKIRYKLVLNEYSIPAVSGSRIYRCQLGVCDEKDALSPVAAVIQKRDTGALGIKNKSGQRWEAVTSKGEARRVAPEDIIPLKDGISFSVDGEKITIKSVVQG